MSDEIPVPDELAETMRLTLEGAYVEYRWSDGYDNGIIDITRPCLPVKYQYRFVTQWEDMTSPEPEVK